MSRIGLIVPSSNVTMETELPELFRRHEELTGERSTFHSARLRHVTREALAAVDAQSRECAVQLAEAHCDVLAYAGLVEVMAAGPGAHLTAARRLAQATGPAVPVVTSAGALVDGIRSLGARRVALIAPYAPELTATVVGYLADAGLGVVDAISLSVTDDAAVGRLDPMALVGMTDHLDLARADAVVLSACVQLPSLAAIQAAQQRTGVPTLSAATATARSLLLSLGREPVLPAGTARAWSRSASHRAGRTSRSWEYVR